MPTFRINRQTGQAEGLAEWAARNRAAYNQTMRTGGTYRPTPYPGASAPTTAPTGTLNTQMNPVRPRNESFSPSDSTTSYRRMIGGGTNPRALIQGYMGEQGGRPASVNAPENPYVMLGPSGAYGGGAPPPPSPPPATPAAPPPSIDEARARVAAAQEAARGERDRAERQYESRRQERQALIDSLLSAEANQEKVQAMREKGMQSIRQQEGRLREETTAATATRGLSAAGEAKGELLRRWVNEPTQMAVADLEGSLAEYELNRDTQFRLAQAGYANEDIARELQNMTQKRQMAQTDEQFAVTQETAMTQLGIEIGDYGLRINEDGRRQFETIFNAAMAADENARANFTTMFDADMQTAMYNLGLDQFWWQQQLDQMQVNLERYGIDEASRRLGMEIQAQAERAREERELQREIARLEIQAAEARARGDRASAERIARQANASKERIAQIQAAAEAAGDQAKLEPGQAGYQRAAVRLGAPLIKPKFYGGRTNYPGAQLQARARARAIRGA